LPETLITRGADVLLLCGRFLLTEGYRPLAISSEVCRQHALVLNTGSLIIILSMSAGNNTDGKGARNVNGEPSSLDKSALIANILDLFGVFSTNSYLYIKAAKSFFNAPREKIVAEAA
jgi:hypothetical protein